MARRKKYNPEKHTWKGKSYKKGGQRTRTLREKVAKKEDLSKKELADALRDVLQEQ